MPIRLSKYVNILSRVGGGEIVPVRELIARIFTTNQLLPTKTLLEFTRAQDVASLFGASSEEYKRALFYFNWINKNNRSPQKIGFMRWTNADTAAKIFGARLTATLAELENITDGAFILSIGGVENEINGLDFSGAASLAAIAALIQTEIRTKTGTQWTSATVTYNATRGGFDFVSGSAIAASIEVAAGETGTDIAQLIGWLPESDNGIIGALWSNGALSETITETLTASTSASNNFASYLFMPELTLDQIEEAAAWNSAIEQNLRFLYALKVSSLVNAQTWFNRTDGALINYAGIVATYNIILGEYAEQCPMMILAATNYDATNGTQNYMYQIFNLTPSVIDDATSDTLDGYRVNYFGQTQEGGLRLSFYQRGDVSGDSEIPSSVNVYANEIWLKSAISAALINLFLAVSKISANDEGRSKIINTLQIVVNSGLTNGTISIDGILSSLQKAYIAEITGVELAYLSVQNAGYWLDCNIVAEITPQETTEYKAEYILVYKKDDVVRSVSGFHFLI